MTKHTQQKKKNESGRTTRIKFECDWSQTAYQNGIEKKSKKKRLRMKTHWSESIWPRENKKEKKKERTKKKGIWDVESTHAAFRDSSTERMWQTGRNKTKPQQWRKKRRRCEEKKKPTHIQGNGERLTNTEVEALAQLSTVHALLKHTTKKKNTRNEEGKKNATKVEGCS